MRFFIVDFFKFKKTNVLLLSLFFSLKKMNVLFAKIQIIFFIFISFTIQLTKWSSAVVVD